MERRKKILLVGCLLYIMYTIFPLLADLIPTPVWLPSIALVVLIWFLYPKVLGNKIFVPIVVYAVVLLIYVLLNHGLAVGIGTVADSKKFFIEMSYILPPASIFSVLLLLDDQELTKKLTLYSFVILFISFGFEYPIMRQYASVREALAQSQDVKIFGLPGYSLMHAYTFAVPVFCYLVKMTKGARRWLAIALLAVLCFIIYDTFVTTSLIIALMIIFFTLLYNGRKQSLIAMGAVSIILVVLWNAGAFTPILDVLTPIFEGTPVEDKLQDFQMESMGMDANNGTLDVRAERHSMSWNAFFSNPLFGDSSMVGGHSTLLDHLGGMGLLAFIPFALIFWNFFKQMKIRYNSAMGRTFFFVNVACSLIFLYTKAMWYAECWLFFLVLAPFGILAVKDKIYKPL